MGNLADVFGTAFGIALTRTKVRVLPAFAVLTLGHLYSSWREVKAFELPYLNRTRLAYTVRRFLATGTQLDSAGFHALYAQVDIPVAP